MFKMYWIIFFILIALIGLYLLYSKKKYIFFEGRIITIDSENQCYKLREFQSSKFLGFDCEWLSNKKLSEGIPKKIAIMQISNETVCFIIKLHKFKYIPKELDTILASNKIYKFGVNIEGDVSRYEKEWDEKINCWIDIRHLSDEIFPNLPKKGLSSLSKTYTGYELKKNMKVICSNWENWILSDEQELYAATDAWVSVQIVNTMSIYTKSKYKKLSTWIDKYKNIVYGKKNKSNKKNKVRSFEKLDNCEMYYLDKR